MAEDTQPLLKDILEEMRGGFATLREEMQTGFAQINARLDRIEKRLTLIEIQVANLNKQMAIIVAEHEDLDNRLTRLEKPPLNN